MLVALGTAKSMGYQLETDKFYVYAEHVSKCQCCPSMYQFEEWVTIEEVRIYVALLREQGFTDFTVIEGVKRGLHD